MFMQTLRTQTSAEELSSAGKTAAMSVSQLSYSSQCDTMAQSCGRIHMVVARLPTIASVHRRALRREDALLVRVGTKEESE